VKVQTEAGANPKGLGSIVLYKWQGSSGKLSEEKGEKLTNGANNRENNQEAFESYTTRNGRRGTSKSWGHNDSKKRTNKVLKKTRGGG